MEPAVEAKGVHERHGRGRIALMCEAGDEADVNLSIPPFWTRTAFSTTEGSARTE